MRTPYRVATFVFVAVAGLLVGLYAGDEWGQMAAGINAMMELSHEGVLQTVVLTEGTDDAREEAILEHLAFEERRRSKYGNSALFSRADMYPTDSMFAYARLARITKRQGKDDRSKAYLNRAITLCLSRPSSKPRDDCTEDKMFEYAALLSRRTESPTISERR
jgi:hypothetical protein